MKMFDLSKVGASACFTGPRPKSLYGYEDIVSYNVLIDVVGFVIEQLVAAGTSRFVSGGAQGFDPNSMNMGGNAGAADNAGGKDDVIDAEFTDAD